MQLVQFIPGGVGKLNKKAYSFRKRIYSIMYILITIQIGLIIDTPPK